MCRKQEIHDHSILLGRKKRESVQALGKIEYRVQMHYVYRGETNKQTKNKDVCISKRAVPLLHHLMLLFCVCVSMCVQSREVKRR